MRETTPHGKVFPFVRPLWHAFGTIDKGFAVPGYNDPDSFDPKKIQERNAGISHVLSHPLADPLATGGLAAAFLPFGRKAGLAEVGAVGRRLSTKAARAELKAHPIRNSFHKNIDETVADKQVASRMKQAYDTAILRQSKRAGVRPGEYLEKGKQSEAAAKVTSGLTAGRAQTLRRDQEALYHEERVKRAQAAEGAMQQTPGVEGLAAAKGQLRGELPKLQFNGLRGLTDDEADSLFTHVQNHPELRTYEKIRVQDALRNAWLEGTVPTNSERKLLRQAFGPEFEKQLLTETGRAKAKRVAFNTLNIPRSLMASFDVSAPFRQGLVAFTRHPLLTGRNLGPMFRVLGSEKGYQALMEDIRSRPSFETMDRSGLAITDMEHALSSREEQFMSNYAEAIPVIGRGVRGSGRAYTGFLVKTRADMFDYLTSAAEKQGVELGEKGLKDLAGYINSATGRGHLGQFERSAVGLNSLFFSPRLIASRLDFLFPWRYVGLDPFVRRQKLRAVGQLVGTMGAALWLADQVPGVTVGIDPRSTDFGKVKAGNTRLDFAGGFNQYVRLIAQITSNQKINQSTGKVEGGKGLDSMTRFIRGKLSPTASIVADAIAHSDYAGQPLSVKKDVASNFVPLLLQDAYAVYHDTGSIPKTLGFAAAGATGVGVQTYGATTPKAKKAKSPRESLLKDLHDYPVPEPYRQKFLQAQEAREALSERKKLEKDRLGKPLTHKQEAAIVLDLVMRYRPDAAPYRQQLVDELNKATDVEAKRELIPRWEKALGFSRLDHYKTVVNRRRDGELERIQKKEMGR